MNHSIRDEQGSILLEFAVSVPLFVLVLVGIANYAYWINEEIQLQEAATAGAAYATIPGNSTDLTGMTAATRASAPTFDRTITVAAVNVYSCTPGGTAVPATATCSTGGPLLFAQVTTSATVYPFLAYAGMPASLTVQGYASYEVVP